MDWDGLSNIILIISILALGVFAFMGAYQLLSRKSLRKVDRTLLCFFIPLILLVITYFLFNNFLILNTRPDGSGIPSFPSSHVMTVATIFFCIAIALPDYLKSKTIRIVLDVIMLILIILVSIARVLSMMHWPSDVIAALVFSLILALIYYLSIRRKKDV